MLLQHVGTWGTFLPWRPGAPSSPAGGRAAAVGGPPPPSQEGLLSHGPGIKAPGGLSWTPGTSQGPEVASTGGHLAWPHLCRHAPWHGPWQLRWQTWPAWRCYAQGVSVREPACLFLGVCVTVRPLAVWLWVCWGVSALHCGRPRVGDWEVMASWPDLHSPLAPPTGAPEGEPEHWPLLGTPGATAGGPASATPPSCHVSTQPPGQTAPAFFPCISSVALATAGAELAPQPLGGLPEARAGVCAGWWLEHDMARPSAPSGSSPE